MFQGYAKYIHGFDEMNLRFSHHSCPVGLFDATAASSDSPNISTNMILHSTSGNT